MLKTARAFIEASRDAFRRSRNSAYSHGSSIQSLCTGFCADDRSVGRSMASFFSPRSLLHPIRGRRKVVSDLKTADLSETEAEKADRLGLEAEIQSTLAKIGRNAWQSLQDLSRWESLARSQLNDIESQLAEPAASVSRLRRLCIICSSCKLLSEGQELLRQMQSNRKDCLAGCAEFRKEIGSQVKRTIAAAPALSLSTVIPFSSVSPPGSSLSMSTGDSGTNTVSLGNKGSDYTLASPPVTAGSERSVTWGDLVDRALSNSDERQSAPPTSSPPPSSPD